MLSGKLCSCCFHSFLHSLYLFSVSWVPGPLVRYGNTCVNKTDRNPWLCNVRKQFSDSAVSYIDINNPQTIIDSFTLWKMTLAMYITCNLRLSVLTWWSSPAAAQWGGNCYFPRGGNQDSRDLLKITWLSIRALSDKAGIQTQFI